MNANLKELLTKIVEMDGKNDLMTETTNAAKALLLGGYEGHSEDVETLDDRTIETGFELEAILSQGAWYFTDINMYTFDGKRYKALEDPYIDNYGTDGEVVYKAHVVDVDGNEYIMMWETTEEFDESGELAALESYDDLSESQKERMDELEQKGVNSFLCEDGSNACDWENPISVTEI